MILAVEDVWKRFGADWALRGVTFSCRGPGLLTIMGPNGSGKSTLARLILGIHAPTRGRISVAGIDPAKSPSEAQKRIAPAIEGTWLPPQARGIDLAAEIALARGVDKAKLLEAARLLGVTDYWRRRIYAYSSGMKKRLLLAIALALAERAEIILLDEPYTTIDKQTRERLAKILIDKSREKLVVIISHIETEAELNADKTIILENGEVVEEKGAC